LNARRIERAVPRSGAAARIERNAGGWIMQRPHRSAPSAASGSSQTAQRGPAARGSARQQASQTPPRKSSSTGRESQARQRDGRTKFVAIRPILSSAAANEIVLPLPSGVFSSGQRSMRRFLDRHRANSVHRVESNGLEEVHVSIGKKSGLILVLLASCAMPGLAQDWGAGASIGLTNDVEHRIGVGRFDPRDANAWVDFRLEDRVLLRATFGSMKTKGSKAGQTAEIDGEEVVLPDLKVGIDYLTIGTSYQFWEGDYTSGIFGGIGGYEVDPDRVEAGLEGFRDSKETVLGFHIGIDGSLRVISHLSIVGRITLHKVFSDTNRYLLTANAGAAFRF
jgi:hypothetical protein